MLRPQYSTLNSSQLSEKYRQTDMCISGSFLVLLCQILPKTHFQTINNNTQIRKKCNFDSQTSEKKFTICDTSTQQNSIPQVDVKSQGLLVIVQQQTQNKTQSLENNSICPYSPKQTIHETKYCLFYNIHGTNTQQNIIQFRRHDSCPNVSKKQNQVFVSIKIQYAEQKYLKGLYKQMYVFCLIKSATCAQVTVLGVETGMNEEKSKEIDQKISNKIGLIAQQLKKLANVSLDMTDMEMAHLYSKVSEDNILKMVMKCQISLEVPSEQSLDFLASRTSIFKFQNSFAWVCKKEKENMKYKELDFNNLYLNNTNIQTQRILVESQGQRLQNCNIKNIDLTNQGQQTSSQRMNTEQPLTRIDQQQNTYFYSLEKKQSLAQSHLHIFDDFDDFDHEQNELIHLKNINKQLKSSNIFALINCWSENTRIMLMRLCDNWTMYQDHFQVEICSFLRINQLKLLKLGCNYRDDQQVSECFYEIIYPQIVQTLRYCLDRLEINDLQQERQEFYRTTVGYYRRNCPTQSSRKQIDVLFYDEVMKMCEVQAETSQDLKTFKIIQEYQIMKKQFGQVSLQVATELHNTIKETLLWYRPKFYYNFTEKNVMQEIAEKIFARKQNKLAQTYLQRSDAYLEEIICEKTPNLRCLGCSEFFFNNVNIYDPNMCKTPIKTFPSILKSKLHETQIKDWICALLNSGGGVLLFNCTKEGNKIYPEGEFLTEKKKQQIEQKLLTYFECFAPRLQVLKHFKISFVPIKNNPLSSQKIHNKKNYSGEEGVIKQNQWYYERDFTKGFYVTRIKVRPLNGWQVHYWYNKKQIKDEKGETIFGRYCNILENESIKLLNTKQITKLIKQRFHQYYLPQELSQDQKRLMAKPFSYFDHECSEPQVVPHVVQSEVKEFVFQVPVSEANSKKQHKNQVTTLNESKYSHMTLLICKRNDLERIKAKLKENDVDCEIEIRFQKHKLRPANNSAIIYHDKSFQYVRNLLTSSSNFNFFNGKPVLLIAVQKILRIDDRNILRNFDQNFMNKCEKYLKSEFQHQKLRFYKSNSGKEYNFEHDYFIQMNSKLSTLYLYFVLSHNNIKASFSNFNRERVRQISRKSPQQKPENSMINHHVFDFS